MWPPTPWDWVDGRSLTELLAGWNALSQVSEPVAQAGRWLADFHQAGPLAWQPADLASKHEHLTTLAATGAAEGTDFQHAVDWLSESLAAVQALPGRCSWLHGDTKADNFLLQGVTAQEVCGIDMDLVHTNAVEHDLAQFLNHLALLAQQRRHRHLAPLLPGAAQAFLAGYEAACGQPVRRTLVHWLRLWMSLSRWHAAVQGHGLAAWPRRWLQRRQHAGLVRDLLRSAPADLLETSAP